LDTIGAMPRMPAWHTNAEPYHHDNTECFYGGEVEPALREAGDGGKPLCQLCERLDRAEDELASAGG
jgi:hypothetical protein